MEDLKMAMSNLWILGGAVPPDPGVVPEPASALIWGGIIALGGLVYWWRRKR
jgi:LPXTG-motif cell wall-anchored protein